MKSRAMLEKWVHSAKEHIFSPDDRPDLLVYGTGTNIWGAQTHQKGFAAFAILAADPAADCVAMGFTRDELIDVACKLLRFTLQSHYEGNYHGMASETEKWGLHWLSSLGIERMMPGVEAIWDYITSEDKALLKKILISEAEWLVNVRKIEADLERPNQPESNLWSGAFLHRIAQMYPDCANADVYREKGTAFLLNSICVPSDKNSKELFDGKQLKDWVVGANFHESYALYHHFYLNVGYMVICLSNIALYHFACKKSKITPPKALYQHSEKLWQLIRSLIFPDGRLIRVGGDTRVRYCYCQDYLIPALYFVKDAFGEDVTDLIDNWIQIVECEFNHNNDNTFLSDRCELMRERSILYYTRLESDRACCLAYDMYWSRIFENERAFGTGEYLPDLSFNKSLSSWKDDVMGACFVRDKERFASFVWEGGEGPMGLCLPLSDSSMAEWRNNMAGVFEGDGLSNHYKTIWHKETLIKGGFLTIGEYGAESEELLEENINITATVKNIIAYAALPDGCTVVTMQYAYAPNRIHLTKVKGLQLLVPNDIFNNNRRNYYIDNNFINIDDKITIKSIYGKAPQCHASSVRQIGLLYAGKLRNSCVYRDRGYLKCDEICTDYMDTPRWYVKNEVVSDFGVAVVLTDKTQKIVAESILDAAQHEAGLRGVKVLGQDGKAYIVIANFGDNNAKIKINNTETTISSKSAEIIIE